MNSDDFLAVGRNVSGQPLVRVRLLSTFAKLLGVQFKIGDWPYGASYDAAINHTRRRESASGAADGGHVIRGNVHRPYTRLTSVKSSAE